MASFLLQEDRFSQIEIEIVEMRTFRDKPIIIGAYIIVSRDPMSQIQYNLAVYFNVQIHGR